MACMVKPLKPFVLWLVCNSPNILVQHDWLNWYCFVWCFGLFCHYFFCFFGAALGCFVALFVAILALFWGSFDAVLGLFWCCFTKVLGYFGDVLVLFWCCFDYCCPVSGCFRLFWSSFRLFWVVLLLFQAVYLCKIKYILTACVQRWVLSAVTDCTKSIFCHLAICWVYHIKPYKTAKWRKVHGSDSVAICAWLLYVFSYHQCEQKNLFKEMPSFKFWISGDMV